MGLLYEKTKLSLLTNGSDIYDNFKNNSLFFYEAYTSGNNNKVVPLNVSSMYPGGFYFIHYNDTSNWMKYSPIFLVDYRQYESEVVLFAINFNFIPLEIRVYLFDKFISEKDFENNNLLKVSLQGAYDELRKLGYEYALVEYAASLIVKTHRIDLTLLPRFLYHQHPINIYDPNKLYSIWEVKLKNREKRHQEMMVMMLGDLFDVNKDINDNFDVMKSHIERFRKSYEKFN